MGDFKDLDVVSPLLVREAKQLPIRGESVVFPPTIDARAARTVQDISRTTHAALADGQPSPDWERLQSAGGLTVSDLEHLEIQLFGDAAADLDRLGVLAEDRLLIAATLVAWHARGRELAERVWNTGARPPQDDPPAAPRTVPTDHRPKATPRKRAAPKRTTPPKGQAS